MRSEIRSIYWQAVTLVLVASFATCLQAQTYPARPIRILVPHPAGGPTDIVARLFAEKLAAQLSQPVIVESRPGANGIALINATIAAPADGYTFALSTNSGPALLPAINDYLKLPQNPDVLKVLAPVSLIGKFYMALTVSSALGVNSASQLIAYAKANPGKLNYGTGAGLGGTDHLSVELFNHAVGIRAEPVPYKGIAAVANALAAGDIQYANTGIGAFLSLHKAGRLKILAVGSTERMPSLPDIPTMAEVTGIPNYEAHAWFGVWVRTGTDRGIINLLSGELQKAGKAPDLLEKAAAIGIDIRTSTPEQLQSLVNTDLKQWAELLKTGNVKF